jgi:hypothetical protein
MTIEIVTKDIIDPNDENDLCRKRAAEERLDLGTDCCIDATGEKREYSIIYKGQKYPIQWKTINWTDPGGKSCNSIKKDNKVNDLIVLHWTVTATAEDCIRVLKERNLGVHFIVSENGVILQLSDLAEVTEHCRGANSRSIGIEVVDPYFLKFQPYCTKHIGPRPIVLDETVHGQKLGPYLGFYDVQELAVSKLVKVICNICNIPAEIPRDLNGNLLKTTMAEDELKKYRGCLGHFHINSQKIDPIGFDFEKMVKKIKEI